MVILASADLLHHIAAAARALDVVGKRHLDAVGAVGMETIISAVITVIVRDVLRGKIQVIVVCDIVLGVAEIGLRLQRAPVVLVDFEWIIAHGKILAFLNVIFEMIKFVPAVIAVGDEATRIITQIIHGLADCLRAPTDIANGLDDQAVVCVVSEPEIERGGTLAVGTAAPADLDIEAVTEIPVQAFLPVDGSDLVIRSERSFQFPERWVMHHSPFSSFL